MTPRTLTVRIDAEQAVETIRPILQSAADLAQAAQALLDFVPANVSPIVLTRERLAELQAAHDAFLDQAEHLLEVRELEDPA